MCTVIQIMYIIFMHGMAYDMWHVYTEPILWNTMQHIQLLGSFFDITARHFLTIQFNFFFFMIIGHYSLSITLRVLKVMSQYHNILQFVMLIFA